MPEINNLCVWIRNCLSLLCRIAKLDRRIGNCTVLACNKWQEIFKECEESLGVSGDAANDVFSAWNKLATDAFQRRTYKPHLQAPTTYMPPPRRANSLTGLYAGRTVKVPVQLIPLEKADELKPEISRPLDLEESSCYCSYPSGLPYRISTSPYAPQADFAADTSAVTTTGGGRGGGGGGGRGGGMYNQQEAGGRLSSKSTSDLPSPVSMGPIREMETAVGPDDMKSGIQSYVDRAFNTPEHPLGILMNRIEVVYRLSFGGVSVTKCLLPHAIAETHSIIQRMHSIVR